jgi:mono/diheme cytochrome c family protein
MRLKSLISNVLGLFLLVGASVTLHAADVNAGKTLFINNCAQCHAKDMKQKLTGPALAGVQAKWGDDAALYAWIRNSQASIAKGVPQAVAIWNEYKPTQMNAFPALADADIENMLAYIKGVADGSIGGKKPVAVVGGAATGDDAGSGNSVWYGLAVFVLGGLALLLTRIINNLNKTSAEKQGTFYQERSWIDALTSKSTIGLVVFALVVLGGYTTVNNAISLGRSQNYEPDQPIKFSHATHAGLQKIECQYCHDGARRSKHGSIPGTNTCMNCHKAIKVGSQYGTAELTKIYASIGYDPSTDKYIPNYENLSEGEVSAVFKKWIIEKYREKIGKTDSSGSVTSDERLIADEQWDEISESLKTKNKPKVQGPIQWVRLHNLPDHVYFNHAQHVAVGKVECQTCHGAVEKMVVMKQHSPLSMGWCINCHRQTEVKFKDNEFYKSYARYHEEFKKGKREKVTVEDIGGLECQKCHY